MWGPVLVQMGLLGLQVVRATGLCFKYGLKLRENEVKGYDFYGEDGM